MGPQALEPFAVEAVGLLELLPNTLLGLRSGVFEYLFVPIERDRPCRFNVLGPCRLYRGVRRRRSR